MAKVRVYELAKEFGVESKAVMARLQEMGEFVRSASSTIEAPVVRKLKEEFSSQGKAAGDGGRPSRRGANGQAAAAPVAPAASPPAEPQARPGSAAEDHSAMAAAAAGRSGDVEAWSR